MDMPMDMDNLIIQYYFILPALKEEPRTVIDWNAFPSSVGSIEDPKILKHNFNSILKRK